MVKMHMLLQWVPIQKLMRTWQLVSVQLLMQQVPNLQQLVQDLKHLLKTLKLLVLVTLHLVKTPQLLVMAILLR